MIAPTQSGKTVFLQTALADMIDQDPGPALYILPDEKTGKRHFQKKIIDVIKESPDLALHLTQYKKDVSKAGIELDNMTVYLGWAGSLATMSSFAMKRVFLDEVRLMPLTQGAESNAIKLSSDRLTTYMDMGLAQGYMVSSPSVEGDLLHQQLSVPGTTVLYWHVPCPHCGKFQYLKFFTHIKFNDKKEEAFCHCQYCDGIFDDSDKKMSWNGEGVWAPEGAILTESGMLETPFNLTERIFFRYNSLVSPFRSFHQIWREFMQTKDKLHDYKNFWQCWLGEFWIEDVSKTSEFSLRERRLAYTRRVVPSGVKVITAGIDTQDSGFYVCVRGFGERKRTWLIDEFFVRCPIDIADAKDIERCIGEDVLGHVYVDKDGARWMPSMAAIDTGGHRTTTIYAVAAKFPTLLMVKGRNEQDATIKYSKEFNLYLVRTQEYLQETEDRCQEDGWYLPKDVEDDYLKQFCHIRKVLIQNKRTGENKVVWKTIGQCDYRMADVHTFICLDVQTPTGAVRNYLEKPDYKNNPIELIKQVDEQRLKKTVASRTTSADTGWDVGAGRNWL